MEDPSLPVSGCRIQWQDGGKLGDPEAGLQDIKRIIFCSLNDQNLVIDSSQEPDAMTEVDVGLEDEVVLERNTEEQSDFSPCWHIQTMGT